MKYKYAIFIVLLTFTMLSFSPFFAKATSVNGAAKKTPEAIVRQFYAEYLTAWNDPNVQYGIERSQKAIESNSTNHLRKLNSNNASGSDYFTHSQEVCPDWVDNISAEMILKKNGLARIELVLGKKDSESMYHINIVKENNKWLMDSVEYISRKTDHCNNN